MVGNRIIFSILCVAAAMTAGCTFSKRTTNELSMFVSGHVGKPGRIMLPERRLTLGELLSEVDILPTGQDVTDAPNATMIRIERFDGQKLHRLFIPEILLARGASSLLVLPNDRVQVETFGDLPTVYDLKPNVTIEGRPVFLDRVVTYGDALSRLQPGTNANVMVINRPIGEVAVDHIYVPLTDGSFAGGIGARNRWNVQNLATGDVVTGTRLGRVPIFTMGLLAEQIAPPVQRMLLPAKQAKTHSWTTRLKSMIPTVKIDSAWIPANPFRSGSSTPIRSALPAPN